MEQFEINGGFPKQERSGKHGKSNEKMGSCI